MGQFAFVGDNEYVMKEVQLPDGHYDYVHSEEEAQELIKAWNKSHKKIRGTDSE